MKNNIYRFLKLLYILIKRNPKECIAAFFGKNNIATRSMWIFSTILWGSILLTNTTMDIMEFHNSNNSYVSRSVSVEALDYFVDPYTLIRLYYIKGDTVESSYKKGIFYIEKKYGTSIYWKKLKN